MPVSNRRSGAPAPASAPASAPSAEGYSAGIAQLRQKRARTGPVARLFGHPERIIGLDLARGASFLLLIALLFAQRSVAAPADAIAPVLSGYLSDLGRSAGVTLPGDLSAVTAALSTMVPLAFVIISGVATARAAGGPDAPTGVVLVQTRLRLLLRAAFILVLAAVLEPLGVPYAGLLGTLGVLSGVAALLIGMSARALLVTAPVWLVVASAGSGALAAAVHASGDRLVPLIEWLTGSPYAPLAWAALFVAGLGVGRLDLRRWKPRLLVGAAAIGCIALAVVSRFLLSFLTVPEPLRPFLQFQPSSAMPLALVAAGGVILLTIALCLCVGDALRWPLAPLSAIGSLAASCGVLVLVLIVVGDTVGREIAGSPSGRGLETLAATLSGRALGRDLSADSPFALVGSVVLVTAACAFFAVVWRLIAGDGPIERLLRMSTGRLAGADRRVGDDAGVVAATAIEADAALPVFEQERVAATSAVSPAVQATPAASGPPQGTSAAQGTSATSAPSATPAVEARRRALATVDPSAVISQWTPGQALGKLPY